MPKITFIDADGTSRVVDAKVGSSIMEAAVQNMIPGIDADCGGACACATCHVYVAEDWADKLKDKDDMEESMLDFAEDVRDNSRLSCQILVTNELDGIVVTTPESQ
ncbi:MAG TPA: 2Fe-2S iron-sulfur cluster binding domain-containing protein [Hellea balneolensis]|uniref:2Fe-2S iron-sulfur cluster binding domain-containing protein n=1 Tax=Hellea balneolensis TaxID=287478 RepID=A0A7C5M007_9PROT|nr:2Fe-2S iron-sulfur cluster binding domain-containing protein [Hellea balneolensis]